MIALVANQREVPANCEITIAGRMRDGRTRSDDPVTGEGVAQSLKKKPVHRTEFIDEMLPSINQERSPRQGATKKFVVL